MEDADNAVNGCDKADRGTEKRMHIANDVYNRLVAEGRCHTYTVEGILDMGDKVIGDEGLQVYTTLDNYFAGIQKIKYPEWNIRSIRIR